MVPQAIASRGGESRKLTIVGKLGHSVHEYKEVGASAGAWNGEGLCGMSLCEHRLLPLVNREADLTNS